MNLVGALFCAMQAVGAQGQAFVEVVQRDERDSRFTIAVQINGVQIDMAQKHRQRVPVRAKGVDEVQVELTFARGNFTKKSRHFARLRTGVTYLFQENDCSTFEMYAKDEALREYGAAVRYGVRGTKKPIQGLRNGEWKPWVYLDMGYSAMCRYADVDLQFEQARSSFIFLHGERLNALYDAERKDLILSIDPPLGCVEAFRTVHVVEVAHDKMLASEELLPNKITYRGHRLQIGQSEKSIRKILGPDVETTIDPTDPELGRWIMSPPTFEGTSSNDITGRQEPSRWCENLSARWRA